MQEHEIIKERIEKIKLATGLTNTEIAKCIGYQTDATFYATLNGVSKPNNSTLLLLKHLEMGVFNELDKKYIAEFSFLYPTKDANRFNIDLFRKFTYPRFIGYVADNNLTKVPHQEVYKIDEIESLYISQWEEAYISDTKKFNAVQKALKWQRDDTRNSFILNS